MQKVKKIFRRQNGLVLLLVYLQLPGLVLWSAYLLPVQVLPQVYQLRYLKYPALVQLLLLLLLTLRQQLLCPLLSRSGYLPLQMPLSPETFRLQGFPP